MQYTATVGRQKAEINKNEIELNAAFGEEKTRTKLLRPPKTSQVKYDLVGKIAQGTALTRKTVSKILSSLKPEKLNMFINNPEEFISKVIRLIKECKAMMIVKNISYRQIDGGEFGVDIFNADNSHQSLNKAYRSKKNIQNYVFTDGTADKSIERRFAEDLDSALEVCVYAKLPKKFYIPTPMGNYTPDWAIVFYENKVKHNLVLAETKGSMDNLDLRPIERAKISCAEKLFNEVYGGRIKYCCVDSYQHLLDKINSL